MSDFAEISARLFHMIRKSDMGEDGEVEVTISFENPHTMYNFIRNIKMELKPYMMDFRGDITSGLENFEFNGVKWRIKINEDIHRRANARTTRV